MKTLDNLKDNIEMQIKDIEGKFVYINEGFGLISQIVAKSNNVEDIKLSILITFLIMF